MIVIKSIEAAALTVDMRVAGEQAGTWSPRVPGVESITIPTIDAASLRQRMQAGVPAGAGCDPDGDSAGRHTAARTGAG